MANEKKPAAPDLGAFSGLEPLDAAARFLNCAAALVPHDRRVEFWQKLTAFCEGPAFLAGEDSETLPTLPASCDKLDRIRKLVDNEDDPGDYPDDVYSLSGGNIDDAFSVGLSYGEALFAESVRKILDA